MSALPHIPQDAGEYALQIAKGVDKRVTCLEDTLQKLIRSEGKRSATRITVIGTAAVALIGAVTQWQVTRLQAHAQLQTAEMARQQIDSEKLSVREVIEETSKKAAKEALDERDRQVDRLTAHVQP